MNASRRTHRMGPPASAVPAPLLGALLLAAAAPGQERTIATETRTLQVATAAPDAAPVSLTVQYVPRCDGTLYVWAISSEFDPRLRIDLQSGGRIAEDDDSGGGTTPWLNAPATAGHTIEVTVASATAAGGRVELHLALAPEDETTRTVAAKAREELAAIEKLQADDIGQARQRIVGVIDELAAVPAAAASGAIAAALFDAAHLASILFKVSAVQKGTLLVLAHREQTMPPTHWALHACRFNLASTYRAFGQPEIALEMETVEIEAMTKVLPPDHLELAEMRAAYGVLLDSLGHPAEARDQIRTALDVLVAKLPPEHEDVLAVSSALGKVLGEIGDSMGGIELERRVYEARKRLLPPGHPLLNVSRCNYATSLRELGDLVASRQLLEEAWADLDNAGDGQHDMRNAVLVMLADATLIAGDARRARQLYERVLEDFDGQVHTMDRIEATVRCNLAKALAGCGEFERAEAELATARALLAELVPEDNGELLLVEQNALIVAADHKAAAERLAALLPAFHRAYGDLHPETHRALSNLLWMRADLGDMAGARQTASELAADLSKTMWSMATSASRAQLEARAIRAEGALWHLIEFAARESRTGSGGLTDDAFTASEVLRGVASWQAAMQRGAAHDPELRGAMERAAHAAAALAEATGDPGGVGTTSDARLELDAAESAVSALAAHKLPADLLAVRPTAGSVRARLGANDALVAYRVYGAVAPGSHPWAGDAILRLCAFVARSTGIAIVDLGELEAVRTAAARWRGAVLGDLRSVRSDGEALRTLVLDPLQPLLAHATNVHALLDDVLHAVSIDSLPEGDGLVGDTRRWTIHSTIWGVLGNAAPAPAPQTLVAFGGVDFDAEGASSAPSVEGAPERVLPERRSGVRFEPLAASEAEVVTIAAMFTARGGAVELRTRGDATATALAALAPRADVLHLATHGWFAPAAVSSLAEERARDGLRLLTQKEQLTGIAPMVLCGIALAGANRAGDCEGRIRGALTGAELAALDLSRCTLAVLSACDSNVGERRNGQGLYSLQRAMHLAGARSTLASLWRVQDAATREFMATFYRLLLDEGQPATAALWNAKATLRGAVDERTGQPRFRPRDWAAWVLCGN